MKPDQIISLMTFAGTDNTFAMADHADHVHVGWTPLDSGNGAEAVLDRHQWLALVGRLGAIENPAVGDAPSGAAVTAP
jgi:hypothetical protein